MLKTDAPINAAPQSPTPARDRRVDILRGVAVLAISANHILTTSPEMTAGKPYRFGHLFAFDFADVFLFLSGLVAGMVLYPLFLRAGPAKCFEKTAARAVRIWGAQLLCIGFAFVTALAFRQGLGVSSVTHDPIGTDLAAGLIGNTLLYRPSPYLNILPVYIMLLPLLPLAFMLFRWSVAAYFALTVSVWALLWGPVFLAGAGVLNIAPETLQGPYFIHPASAQLLFFTGVAIGIGKPRIEALLTRAGPWLFCALLAFLIITNYMSQLHWMVHHFDQKVFTGPLRLAELLAVLALLCRLFGPQDIRTPRIGLVEACGRHTLPVFVASTAGAFLFSYLADWLGVGRLGFGLCVLANVGLCMMLAQLLEHRALPQLPKSPERPAAPLPMLHRKAALQSRA